MFKKFSLDEISGQNQVKASVQRRIRQSIADEYPLLEPVLEDLLPKKVPLIVTKCQNHLNLVVVNNVPLFFNIRDGPYMPTLRLLHQYPEIMRKFQVDRGAIKFVLSGANIMCPGLTSPGGALDQEVPAETPVSEMSTTPVPRRESPWGRPEGDKRQPVAHRCNDRAEDVVQACFEGNPFKTVPGPFKLFYKCMRSKPGEEPTEPFHYLQIDPTKREEVKLD